MLITIILSVYFLGWSAVSVGSFLYYQHDPDGDRRTTHECMEYGFAIVGAGLIWPFILIMYLLGNLDGAGSK